MIAGPFEKYLFWSVFAVSWLISAKLVAADFFVTFAPNVDSAPPWKEADVQAASTAKESRPADQDPDGNWSEQLNGFQLSIRFETNMFRSGEPIPVNIFLRNISENPLSAPLFYAKAAAPLLCRLIVTYEDGRAVDRIEEPLGLRGSGRIRSLHPKSQWKTSVRLNDIFKMEMPGTYRVTGITGVGEPPVEIRTAHVQIQVVVNDSGAEDVAAVAPNTSPTTIPRKATPSAIDRSFHPLKNDSGDALRSRLVSKSNAGAVSPLAGTPPMSATNSLSSGQKTGMGISAALLALLLAILWRAARRKPEA